MKKLYACVIIIFCVALAVAIGLNVIKTGEIVPPTETIDESIVSEPEIITDFSKTAFIGDSRTQGLMLYSGVADATYYTEMGLTVLDVVEKPIIDESKTIIQALKDNNFERIYIMLGINELGWAYSQSFEDAYNRMLDEIEKNCPQTEIILQTIMPVNVELMKNPKDYLNNERIMEFNDIIKRISNTRQIKCLDIHGIMCDENGNLYKEASTDGIHLNLEFCHRWMKFLKGEKLDEI